MKQTDGKPANIRDYLRQPVVFREVGIPPETMARQSRRLADCVRTFGRDDPRTIAYVNGVARYRAICSRIEAVVDIAKVRILNEEI